MLKGYKDFYELEPKLLAQAVHLAADIQRRPGCYVYRVEAGELAGVYSVTAVEKDGRVLNMLALSLETVPVET
jgi:hypothetical protein